MARKLLAGEPDEDVALLEPGQVARRADEVYGPAGQVQVDRILRAPQALGDDGAVVDDAYVGPSSIDELGVPQGGRVGPPADDDGVGLELRQDGLQPLPAVGRAGPVEQGVALRH